jgi:peptidoglycan/xylan/chitin deacetylase (PgdA/CDA1 family)
MEKNLDLRISIDDGRQEMIRVAEMLDKKNLRGIFYIAPFESKNNLTARDIFNLSCKHEIGGHTLTHKRLTELDLENAEYEITEGKLELERIIKKKIYKFASPRGWHNEKIIKLIQKAKFKEHRTTKMGIVDITGYSKMKLPCSAHLYPREEYRGDVLNGVLNKFKEAKEKGNYFNLLIHTDEVRKFGLWETLENIFEYIKKNK